MKTYKIPVCYQMYGYFNIEAESLEDAILIAESAEVGLPEDASYVLGSFEVDHDGLSWDEEPEFADYIHEGEEDWLI